ncbi:MAG TPA: SDR family oxidoreductase [Chitinophagales bacterium]|nr:SDR family oxidoreductase [Chitinophagales bacterium]
MGKISLKDKVVVITGASSGIGKACAVAFAKEGARVMLAARDEVKLRNIVEEILKQGHTASFCKTDVSHEDDCRKLMEATIHEFGTIHVLINNAGISMRALFSEVDLKVIHQLMDINFWGTVNCTKYAMAEILKNKGSIAGVSSIAGFKGLPGRTGYSASKFAMQGFLDALRVENLKTGVHVMVVCPGYTASNIRNTALNNQGQQQGDSPLDESKLMSAEEVAGYIVHGIVRSKRTVILTLQGKMTVLLNKFFPSFMDRMVYNVVSKDKDSPFK